MRPVYLREWFLLATVLLICAAANSGSLSGTVSNSGLIVDLEDFVEVPASSTSRPYARINGLVEANGLSSKLFVNDLRGKLYVIDRDSAAVSEYFDLAANVSNFKDAPGLASGFVSVAFHPEFSSNGKFYTVHTETPGSTPPTIQPPVAITVDQHSILTEWTQAAPANLTFFGVSREVMRIASPNRFHNLGEIAFNPYAQSGDSDYGLLYLGGGDYGAVAIGQAEQLQRTDTVYGAILRIDPISPTNTAYDYNIPAGNPFAASADPDVRKEIFAYGFRNAHRLRWFDASNPKLLAFDIGQDNLEEVNWVLAGENYGWPEREGSYALDVSVDPSTVFALPANDASFGYRYPVAQYDHEEGDAIAGGVTLDGNSFWLEGLGNQLVFGDIVSGRLLKADLTELVNSDDGDPDTTADLQELSVQHNDIVTDVLQVVREELTLPGLGRADLRMSQDQYGNIYILTKQDGMIRKLIVKQSVSIGYPWFAVLMGGLFLVWIARKRFNSVR